MNELKMGQAAPDFTLVADNGEPFTLASLKGSKIVLYFYSKDNTSGCTAQAREYSELSPRFQELGTVILGVSRDSTKRHVNFKNKHQIPFTLLSDPDHRVHEIYGAWGDKKVCGKPTQGVFRTTVAIDENGIITDIKHKVKAKGDAARILGILEAQG